MTSQTMISMAQPYANNGRLYRVSHPLGRALFASMQSAAAVAANRLFIARKLLMARDGPLPPVDHLIQFPRFFQSPEVEIPPSQQLQPALQRAVFLPAP
jgi:hypothetical protein